MVPMLGAIMPAPFAIPPTVTVFPPALKRATAPLGHASVVRIASAAAPNPFAEREAHSAGRAAVIFPSGSRTPMTPVEDTRREPSGSPRALLAEAEVRRTDAMPSSPVQAFAFPLFTTTPRRRPRVFSPFPHATGAAYTRFLVNTTSETQGVSE